MISQVQGRRRFPWNAFTLTLGAWVVFGASARADGGPGCDVHPGFQGFGLGYHLGRGYGGDAAGVGPDGGYPFYGGPGYPHPWPRLRRIGGINPFPYFGGPGFPCPGQPNFFGNVGPLVSDPPVIEVAPERGEADYSSGYGAFTGTLPYPETAFAPFTTAIAAGASTTTENPAYPVPPSANTPPATGTVPLPPATGRSLGFESEPIVDAAGARGLKVTRVETAGAAEKAGLHVGDVIRSINGYLTAEPGNLTWIIANAASDHVLKMKVLAASNHAEQTVNVRLP